MTAPNGATPATPPRVDLHAHSSASDGARAPTDVVAAAHAAKLVALALTDHDTVTGIPEAEAAGTLFGVRIVPGVELSAVEGDTETHLLGLHLSSLGEIEAGLADLREMRRARAVKIVQRLNDLGVRITIESVLEQSAGGAIGRPHVARAMIHEGWATDTRDAFDRYLGNGRPAFVAKERLTMRDAIAMVHRSGGLAVLAHPSHAGTRERIQALVGVGLDGVEVLHPSHSGEDVARLRALTEYFGLVPSGGSDWHGADEGARTLGAMNVPAEWLAQQDARVAERAAARVA